jgi:hypothetical protein
MKKLIILSCIFSFALMVVIGLQTATTHAQTQLAVPPSYVYNNDLTLGSSGADVTQLQTWLMNNGYSIPSVSSGMANKGYFGTQTRAALISYQRSIGLPAFGFFGPLTRQYFNRGDNGGNGGNGGILNPAAPFQITRPNGGESWLRGTTQSITWTSPNYFQAAYVDIKLVPYVQPCTSQICPMVAQSMLYRMPYTIATGISVNQNSYSWNVGNVQSLTPYVTNNSYPYPSTQVASDGQYTVQICQTNSSVCTSSASPFTIYTNGQTNGQPVINGIDAPTTLSVNQLGTWTVHATDPYNGTLSYLVLWGDEPSYAVTGGTMTSPQIAQTTTFQHSYVNAGVYTVTFTVRNSSGGMMQTSSTVTVGGSTVYSSTPDINVVSPNGGEVWQMGIGRTISFNVTGDPARIGNNVTAFLVNSSGQQIPFGNFSQGISQGLKTFNVTVPSNVPGGSYKLMVNLYNGSQLQAYDSSDNYFTIDSGMILQYGGICPPGYSCTLNAH